MKLKKKLLLEEVAYNLILIWDDIQDYRLKRMEKEIASLKVMLYDYISTNPDSDVDYIMTYIRDSGNAKLFLILQEVVIDYRNERGKFSNKISKINFRNLFKGIKNAEKVRFDNTISIGGNSDANINS